MKDHYIGRKTNQGLDTVDVDVIPPTTLLLEEYSPYFILYIKAQKTFKNGNTKTKTFDIKLKSKYCPYCGEQHSEDHDGHR